MNHQEIWETYAASWRATDAAEKMALFAQCLDADCQYQDPLATARGWEELTAYMLEFHRQIPGGHFVTTEFLTHNNKSVARWEMRDNKDAVLGTGISYGEYTESGRLHQMTGFYPLPQA